jgi:hypothetical protein
MDESTCTQHTPTEHAAPGDRAMRPAAGGLNSADRDARFTSRAARSTDPSRAGAVWVAGTGAFLLLVAAATFVASQWDHIPPPAKLAALGLASGLLLVAGRTLRPALPATAGVLTHLGALLVPVVAVAVGVHLRADAGTMALGVGVSCSPLLWWVERTQRSVVLSTATVAGVAVGTLGAAAVAGAPGAMALAVLAGIGLAAGAPRAAVAWALAAGVALVATGWDLPDTTRWWAALASDVGLVGADARWTAATAGIGSAAVLLIVAHRRHDPVLVIAGAGIATIGSAITWGVADPGPDVTIVGLGLLLLTAQLAAAGLRHDPFWSRITHPVAVVAEVVAALITVAIVPTILLETFDLLSSPAHQEPAAAALGIQYLLVATTWLVADGRRRHDDAQTSAMAALTGSGFAPTAPGVAVALAATAVLWVPPVPAAVAMAAVAAALVCTGRPWSGASALGLVTTATVLAHESVAVAVAIGVAGGMLVAWSAGLRARSMPLPHPTTMVGAARGPAARWAGPAMINPGPAPGLPAGTQARIDAVTVLALGALLPVSAAMVVLAGTVAHLAALAAAVAALWAVGWVTETAITPSTPWVHLVARWVAVAVVVSGSGSVVDVWMVAGGVCLLVAGDVARLDRPDVLWPATLAVPVLVLDAGAAWTVDAAVLGALLVVAAGAAASVAVRVGDRWQPPVVAVAATTITTGWLVGLTRPSALGTVALLTGVLLVGGGLLASRNDVALGGALVGTFGVHLHLAVAGVGTVDAYLAPVGMLLVAVGASARRTQVLSSWVAYGPAIALVGGAALLERLDGGPAVHAVVAGAIGAAAVAVGGWGRLAAPLLVGTALLVGVAAHESLAVTTALPTWVWLAAGGSTLLGAGIALERSQTGPMEQGRRLVDAVSDRFD